MATDRYWDMILEREVVFAKERQSLGISGCCFDGEPRVTACSELKADETVIPNEAWAIHGEESEEELDMGFPMEQRHIDLENVCEEEVYPERGENEEEEEECQQEDREAGRLDEGAMAKAGANLIRMCGLIVSPAICDVVAAYLREKMDGVIRHYFLNLADPSITDAVLEFVKKMVRYTPEVSKTATSTILSQARIERHEMNTLAKRISRSEISPQAKAKLVARAQQEQQRPECSEENPTNTCHSIRLGRALFGRDHFSRMLRA